MRRRCLNGYKNTFSIKLPYGHLKRITEQNTKGKIMSTKLITDSKGIKVFRKEKEYNGNTFYTYSISDSTKDDNGNWINKYRDIRFRKGIEVPDKAEIIIKDSFPVLRKGNDGTVYETWMIMDFEFKNKPQDNDGFMNIPDGVDEYLPFK